MTGGSGSGSGGGAINSDIAEIIGDYRKII
jgi:hypothetical protein